MKPEEIRPGATYEGADGERREVLFVSGETTRVSWLFCMRRWVSFTNRGDTHDVRIRSWEKADGTLSEFAAWAQREVRDES